jgi:ATP-dependent helicase/nuclease subunit A
MTTPLPEPISDYFTRQEALNPEHSYIVQAPAGSGKTELLTQRFLKLLTCVDDPESIVALTFTQKAAAEMRERILSAIEKVANNERNAQPETDKLAQQVLAHDKKRNWQLLQSPHRLRVQTIDSLCFELVAKMPILSQGIPYASIAEDPTPYYQEAAERTLAEGIADSVYQKSIKILLLHLGNHYARCLDLLADMLSWREQWLSPIVYAQSLSSPTLKKTLEAALKHLQEDAITHLENLFSKEIKQELFKLCEYSANNLVGAKNLSPADLDEIEKCFSSTETKFWQQVTTLLLTQDNTWRSRVDKNIGFPPPSEALNSEEKMCFKNMKQRLETLLSTWRENLHQSESYRLALENYRRLPPITYSENQWEILEALLTLLPLLAAQLNLVFMESGKTDFSEIAEQASWALGKLDEPSDLALHCDYSIQHLLIDEFQDTSFKQFRLLEKLTYGWQPGDGRTLFIVGDPMQSIYRFREADVGLFLKARESGIGSVTLNSLTLTRNFRSTPELINWINNCFKTIFPSQDEYHLGAVKHHSSEAGKTSYSHEGKIQFYTHETPENQGKSIAEAIKNIPSNESIALLVRSRSQLKAILPYLQQANIAFQGVDIDALSTRSSIQDLCSLTQALLQPSNQLAWYAVLRAPWCGLKLADLWALTQNTELSEDGKIRFDHVQSIILHARQERQKTSLSLWVETTWRTLGGHLYTDATAQNDVETFWNLLDSYTHEYSNLTQDLLEKVNKLYSNTARESHVHVMTIHKSKGLEFDHVFLPHLESLPTRKDTPLLQHMENRTRKGKNDLLLAVMKSIEASQDPLYQYLQHIHDKKEIFERQRLLYVALTRARTQLHLFAVCSTNAPSKNSFLHGLAPHLPEAITTEIDDEMIAAKNKAPMLRRFSSDYFEFNKMEQPTIGAKNLSPVDRDILIDGRKIFRPYTDRSELSDLMKIIGTFIHEQIQYCAEHQLSSPAGLYIPFWKNRLIELGIYTAADQEKALAYAHQAINNLYKDPRGQWILNPAHQEAYNEYALNYLDTLDNITLRTAIIDRTFLDVTDNTRWIIDYKISQDIFPTGELSVEFAPLQYREQLEQYAEILGNFLKENERETVPIHLGLYYPMTKTWIAWLSLT